MRLALRAGVDRSLFVALPKLPRRLSTEGWNPLLTTSGTRRARTGAVVGWLKSGVTLLELFTTIAGGRHRYRKVKGEQESVPACNIGSSRPFYTSALDTLSLRGFNGFIKARASCDVRVRISVPSAGHMAAFRMEGNDLGFEGCSLTSGSRHLLL